MKIKVTIMISAIGFALVSMIAYAIFANMFIGKSGGEEFYRQIGDLVENEGIVLNSITDTAITNINTIAKADVIATAAKNGSSNNAADELIERFADEYTDIAAANLIKPNGAIICGTDEGKTVGNIAWYAALDDNVLYIDSVGELAAGTTTMVIKQKVSDCILVLSYNISSDGKFISKLTNNSTFYRQGSVTIVDCNRNWTDGRSSSNTSLTNKYSAEVETAIGTLQENTASNIIEYNSNGTTYLACMIKSTGAKGLIAIASVPANMSNIFSSGTSGTIIAVTVFLSIVSIAGAIVLAMMITKPLNVIEETLVKIRRGDHEARISAVSNNEYGQISRAFNNLVDEIVVSEDRYRIISEMSDNIIFEWNFRTNEVVFSNNFNKKFSYRAPSDHFGDSFLMKAKVHPDDSDRYKEDLGNLEKGTNFERNEYRIKNIYGDFIWVLIRTATLHDKDGKAQKVVGVMLDIDRAKKSEQQLTERASYDALTELYNRETIESQIDNEISLSEARKSEMAVLFIDVDDFKHYNDNYSHATGDQVLKFVGKTIRSVVDPIGFVGRYGGDEFIACIRNTEVNDVSDVAHKIIDKLAEGFDSDTGDKLTVSVSIGIAKIKDDYNTRVEYLIGKADDAMYSVKKSGKSNFAFI